MRLKKLVVGLVLVAAMVGVGYQGYLQYLAPVSDEADSASSVAAQPSAQTKPEVISAEGELVPIRHVSLSMQLTGEIAELLVEEGERVSVGDPLIRLAARDYELALEQAIASAAIAEAAVKSANAGLTAAQAGLTQARIGVDTAEAQLDLVQASPREEELAVARAAVAAAESGVLQAEASRAAALETPDSQIRAAEAQVAAAAAEHVVIREQYDQLLRNEISGALEEQTRFALNASSANLQAAQSVLDELLRGETAAQKGALDASVNAAESQLHIAQSQLELLLAPAPAEQVVAARTVADQAAAAVLQAEALVSQAEALVSQAEAAKELAESAVDTAQLALDKTVLRAPFSGVVAEFLVEEGELLASGFPAATYADFSHWQVETTDVTELDVVAISENDPVTILVDALAELRLKGMVVDISQSATQTRGDVTYVVTIRLNDVENLPLRWGMTVYVDIDVR